MQRALVITVSDSVHAGSREDRSGPAVRDQLRSLGWDVALEVLPDEAQLISERLAGASNSYALIVTTGGTGVAMRDVTPEATRAVVEKEIQGIGEAMRSSGRAHTPLAVLSRGIAGTRGRTLIVNLPGSPKGAVESLDAVVNLIPHVIDLLAGKTDHKQ